MTNYIVLTCYIAFSNNNIKNNNISIISIYKNITSSYENILLNFIALDYKNI